MKGENPLGILCFIIAAANINAKMDTNTVVIRNCSIYWVGAVMWNEDHTAYTDVPEFEVKGEGTKVIKLKDGDYAITVFRQRQAYRWQGKVLLMPAKIVDYKEITVNSDRKLEFGCHGEYR